MSFTARDVMNIAVVYYDESLDDALVIYAINRALGLIGDSAMKYTTMTIAPTDTTTFNTTNASCTSIKWVKDSNGLIYDDWESYDPRSIRFDDTDTYTLLIKVMPTEISTLDTTIDLHPIFEQPLVTYLIGFAKLADDDANPDGQKNLEQDFLRDVARAALSISNRKSPSSATVIRSGNKYYKNISNYEDTFEDS